MNFPCTGCGMCCKNAGSWVAMARTVAESPGYTPAPLIEEVAGFPYAFDEHGACEKLGADNKCTVYDHRPDICSIEITWQKHHASKDPAPTLQEYYTRAIAVCNSMMKAGGVSEEFYIKT